ncbi:MAG TPA: outer membrane beta-barrel protein [Nitrospira sp.]|nr:outer membrane beta-barrel protein [Nitrospira sp.]
MKEMRLVRGFVSLVVIVLAITAFARVREAYGETYVAGQIGVTLPSVVGGGLGQGDLTGVFTPGSTISEQSLDNSILYGAKIGHYFRAIPWFGIEFEVYNSTPHIKQQPITFSGPSGPVGTAEFPGLNFRVLTVAPANLTFRYRKWRVQPYVAFGPGVFFARIKDPSLSSDNTQSSTSIGLNAQGGVRYYITRHLAVFGEAKFNYARFSFDETPPGAFNLFGFDSTYKMFHASFGLSFHF